MKDVVYKQPYEVFGVTVNFSRNMSRSESVAVGTVSVEDKNGTDATSTIISGSPSWATKTVVATVMDGSEDNSPYKLTFRCETNTGNKWESEVYLCVKDL